MIKTTTGANSNLSSPELDAVINQNYTADFNIESEPPKVQNEIKSLCTSCDHGQLNKNYNFIWVDPNMDTYEN